MPLTSKGNKILSSMEKQYGPKKGKSVFYASINSGRLRGVEGRQTGGTTPPPTDIPAPTTTGDVVGGADFGDISFGGLGTPEPESEQAGRRQRDPLRRLISSTLPRPGDYADGGIVDHDNDRDLPRSEDGARLEPQINYPPEYLRTIELLLQNQRRAQGLDRFLPGIDPPWLEGYQRAQRPSREAQGRRDGGGDEEVRPDFFMRRDHERAPAPRPRYRPSNAALSPRRARRRSAPVDGMEELWDGSSVRRHGVRYFDDGGGDGSSGGSAGGSDGGGCGGSGCAGCGCSGDSCGGGACGGCSCGAAGCGACGVAGSETGAGCVAGACTGSQGSAAGCAGGCSDTGGMGFGGCTGCTGTGTGLGTGFGAAEGVGSQGGFGEEGAVGGAPGGGKGGSLGATAAEASMGALGAMAGGMFGAEAGGRGATTGNVGNVGSVGNVGAVGGGRGGATGYGGIGSVGASGMFGSAGACQTAGAFAGGYYGTGGAGIAGGALGAETGGFFGANAGLGYGGTGAPGTGAFGAEGDAGGGGTSGIGNAGASFGSGYGGTSGYASSGIGGIDLSPAAGGADIGGGKGGGGPDDDAGGRGAGDRGGGSRGAAGLSPGDFAAAAAGGKGGNQGLAGMGPGAGGWATGIGEVGNQGYGFTGGVTGTELGGTPSVASSMGSTTGGAGTAGTAGAAAADSTASGDADADAGQAAAAAAAADPGAEPSADQDSDQGGGGKGGGSKGAATPASLSTTTQAAPAAETTGASRGAVASQGLAAPTVSESPAWSTGEMGAYSVAPGTIGNPAEMAAQAAAIASGRAGGAQEGTPSGYTGTYGGGGPGAFGGGWTGSLTGEVGTVGGLGGATHGIQGGPTGLGGWTAGIGDLGYAGPGIGIAEGEKGGFNAVNAAIAAEMAGRGGWQGTIADPTTDFGGLSGYAYGQQGNVDPSGRGAPPAETGPFGGYANPNAEPQAAPSESLATTIAGTVDQPQAGPTFGPVADPFSAIETTPAEPDPGFEKGEPRGTVTTTPLSDLPAAPYGIGASRGWGGPTVTGTKDTAEPQGWTTATPSLAGAIESQGAPSFAPGGGQIGGLGVTGSWGEQAAPAAEPTVGPDARGALSSMLGIADQPAVADPLAGAIESQGQTGTRGGGLFGATPALGGPYGLGMEAKAAALDPYVGMQHETPQIDPTVPVTPAVPLAPVTPQVAPPPVNPLNIGPFPGFFSPSPGLIGISPAQAQIGTTYETASGKGNFGLAPANQSLTSVMGLDNPMAQADRAAAIAQAVADRDAEIAAATRGGQTAVEKGNITSVAPSVAPTGGLAAPTSELAGAIESQGQVASMLGALESQGLDRAAEVAPGDRGGRTGIAGLSVAPGKGGLDTDRGPGVTSPSLAATDLSFDPGSLATVGALESQGYDPTASYAPVATPGLTPAQTVADRFGGGWTAVDMGGRTSTATASPGWGQQGLAVTDPAQGAVESQGYDPSVSYAPAVADRAADPAAAAALAGVLGGGFPGATTGLEGFESVGSTQAQTGRGVADRAADPAAAAALAGVLGGGFPGNTTGLEGFSTVGSYGPSYSPAPAAVADRTADPAATAALAGVLGGGFPGSTTGLEGFATVGSYGPSYSPATTTTFAPGGFPAGLETTGLEGFETIGAPASLAPPAMSHQEKDAPKSGQVATPSMTPAQAIQSAHEQALAEQTHQMAVNPALDVAMEERAAQLATPVPTPPVDPRDRTAQPQPGRDRTTQPAPSGGRTTTTPGGRTTTGPAVAPAPGLGGRPGAAPGGLGGRTGAGMSVSEMGNEYLPGAVQQDVNRDPGGMARMMTDNKAIAGLLQQVMSPEQMDAVFGEIGFSRKEQNPAMAGPEDQNQNRIQVEAAPPPQSAGLSGMAQGGLVSGPGYYAQGGLGISQMQGQATRAHYSGANIKPALKPPGVHLISSSTSGRTDRVPMRARPGSFVLPADVVSGLGQGNTQAGAKMWGTAIAEKIGPVGIQNAIRRRALRAPPMRGFGGSKGFAEGGQIGHNGGPPMDDDELTPIICAGGECLVDPEFVEEMGDGDPARGKKELIESVMSVRKQVIDHLKKLPRPAQ